MQHCYDKKIIVFYIKRLILLLSYKKNSLNLSHETHIIDCIICGESINKEFILSDE